MRKNIKRLVDLSFLYSQAKLGNNFLKEIYYKFLFERAISKELEKGWRMS